MHEGRFSQARLSQAHALPVFLPLHCDLDSRHIHKRARCLCVVLLCSLEIRGSGFSQDRLTGENIVYVGPFPCNVIDHYTTDTLVCACVKLLVLA